MPPLSHVPPDRSVPLENSEVFQWMSRNNELLYYLFERARSTYSIRFDYARRKWCGCHTPVPAPEPEDRGRVETSLMPSRGPGRPPNFRVQDLVDLLSETPVTVAEWAQKSAEKLGISRRTFATIKKRAISSGKVTTQQVGRQVLCSRSAEKIRTGSCHQKSSN